MNLKGYVLNIMLAILITVVVGCGGGGGGEEATPPAAVELSVEPLVESLTLTKDLSVASNFQFATAREVSFNIQASALKDQRTFVSVFSDFFTTDYTTIGQYDSRLFIQEMSLGKMDKTIMITNDIKQVLVQVWTDNASDIPNLIVVNIDSNNQVSWSF